MTVVIDQPHLIDTMRYRIATRKTLVREDVRVTTQVIALVRTGERDQLALEHRIRDALATFIVADWAFSRIEREADASGYERIRLVASARIKAGENFNLSERARTASAEGLTLTNPKVDYAFSREKIDAVFDELRHEILVRVIGQVISISSATGRTWRIGDIAFGAIDPENGGHRTGKGAYRDDEDVWLGIGGADDDRGIAGAERVSLIASVTLKAPV